MNGLIRGWMNGWMDGKDAWKKNTCNDCKALMYSDYESITNIMLDVMSIVESMKTIIIRTCKKVMKMKKKMIIIMMVM